MENIMLYDLTVGQYQLLREIGQDDSLTLVEQNIYMVAALKDITYDEASKLRMSEFNNIVKGLNEIDIRALEKGKINSSIYLNGEEYRIEHRPEKLTSGQLLDIINLRSKHQGESIQIMDLIMAALSRPAYMEYGDDGLTLHERAKYCRDVKVTDVWNVFVFFWNLWNDYLNNSEDYLQAWMEQSLQKANQILKEGGDYSE